ncbi:hypothetical protein [Chryseobacterium sp. G0201]|uniref:hypothetical protein n=1 Tax=Chryseobacterium sp. G0201 TaxID=2487065 RepID=UPI000F4D9F67|nr:hypothetical protein [Chryseobacterium sp. G0201]AZA54082.1 hypothetical protein EG348_14280 [Chryseobacterium sp. G0201]
MPKNDLKYIDFRTASFRNLNVCKELLERLDNCESKNKNNILHKIYYLSGYIIEFSYKYALFHHLGLNKIDNIYNFGDDSFKKKWKDHDFSKLRLLCTDNKLNFSTDIPYFGSKIENKEIESLINSWDVQIRYNLSLANNTIMLDESRIKDFVSSIEDILNKITTKFS